MLALERLSVFNYFKKENQFDYYSWLVKCASNPPNVFRELLIELLVVLLIFRQLSEEFQALFDQILPDNFLQNFALLQHLTGNVQGG